MKIRRLFFISFTLILVFNLIFASGCSLLDFPEKITGEYEKDPLLPVDEKAMDEAIASAEKELEAEKEKAQVAEEEEKLIPDEPITLKGSVWDSALTLIIDLQSGDVGGSLYFDDGEDTYNLTIKGDIDLETYKFNGVCSGLWVSKPLDISEIITVTIDGQLNKDLNGASGTSTGNAGTDNWTAD